MIKKTVVTSLTPTKATYYTTPIGKRTSWVMMWVSNTSGSNSSISVYYYNKETDTEIPFFSNYPVNSKTFVDVGGQVHEFIILDEGDEIRALCSQSSTAIFSLIENNNIIRGG